MGKAIIIAIMLVTAATGHAAKPAKITISKKA